MKHTPWTYLGLAVIFVLSSGTYFFFPVESIMRYIAGVPAIGALVTALFQLVRDQAAFERQLALHQRQEAFGLGATSHMATVVFDKHAEFCEKYMAEVHDTVSTLFRQGLTRETFPHVASLVQLRRDYAAWLPQEIDTGLEPFETAVNQIGALSALVEGLGSSDQSSRGEAIKKSFTIFEEMLNIDGKLPLDNQPAFAVEKVKEHIRTVLGVTQLTALRRKLVERALQVVSNDD